MNFENDSAVRQRTWELFGDEWILFQFQLGRHIQMRVAVPAAVFELAAGGVGMMK